MTASPSAVEDGDGDGDGFRWKDGCENVVFEVVVVPVLSVSKTQPRLRKSCFSRRRSEWKSAQGT